MLRAIRGRRPRMAAAALFCLSCMGIAMLGCLVINGTAAAQRVHTATSSVSFTLMEVIEVLSWPSATVAMTGAPDEPAVSGPLVFRVRANAPWGIYLRSDLPEGRMQEYDASVGEYVQSGRVLSQGLEWALSPGGPWTRVVPADAPLVSGMPPTGAEGTTVEFFLRQAATFQDLALPAGREYRIVLTYTAGLGY